ncbi:MAG: tyrosine-type recombinase/integrase [Allorhizobium sp.]
MKGHIRERSPGKWAIVIDVPDPETGERRRKWHTFHGTKREAQTECARLITELKGGMYIEPSKVTLREYFIRWLEHEKAHVSPGTHHRYESLLLTNVASVIGSVFLTKIDASKLDQAWAKLLASGRRDGTGGLSPRTVHHCRRVMLTAMDQAVKWKLIPHNPVALTRPPKVQRPKMSTYTVEETARLFAALRGTRMFIPALLAVLCGLRRGEILALRWENIDLKAGTISVQESLEQVKTEVRFKEPKSGIARQLSISSTVIEELKKHRASQAEEQLKLGIRPDKKSFVVAQVDGKLLKPVSLTHEWTRLINKTGLPKIRFHDLRHTHATQMLASGVHPKIASERLGHSTIAITMDLYSHVMPDMQASAAEQVDAAIKAATKPLTE